MLELSVEQFPTTRWVKSAYETFSLAVSLSVEGISSSAYRLVLEPRSAATEKLPDFEENIMKSSGKSKDRMKKSSGESTKR